MFVNEVIRDLGHKNETHGWRVLLISINWSPPTRIVRCSTFSNIQNQLVCHRCVAEDPGIWNIRVSHYGDSVCNLHSTQIKRLIEN